MYVFHMSCHRGQVARTTALIHKGMDSYVAPHRWSLNWAEDFAKYGIRTQPWIVPGTEEEEG